VAVAPIVERDLPATVRLVGSVRPDRAGVVSAELAGLVAKLNVDVGQFVRRGEVLCELDRSLVELRLAEARGRLGALRADLEQLLNGTRPEELKRWEAALAEAEAIHKKWEFENKRIADLYRRNQSNDKERNDAEMEFIAAARRVAATQAQLEEARNGPRRETIAKARADVAAQEAVVARFERDLTKTSIRAPFDGFVAEKRTELGEWIQEGGPVCDLVNIESVRVRADVPESAVLFARPGAPVSVEVDALGRSLPAAITRVIPVANPAARTFPVEIDLPNADHTVLPGMFCWVRVPAGPPGRRLLAHRDAIVARGTSKQVFVVRREGNATAALPVTVTTGLEVGGEIEVSSAELQAGDLLVVRGNERLFGPTPVEPMMSAASQPAAARAD
jgi:multidrug efflux pump subunit AcrA (membrane-fusion protein)